MRRLFPYKKVVLAIVLVAASVLLMNITGSSEGAPSFWERLFWKGIEPCVNLFSAVRDTVTDYAVLLESKQELMEQNEELKRRVASLELLLAQLQEVQERNQRLEELLQFREQLEGEYKGAYVIGRNPSKWFSAVTIGLGEEDGLKVNAPVLSKSGLAGRIIKVDQSQAQVLLLTDPESGAGALVSRSRDYGVVVGGGGPKTLTMTFFSKDVDVKVGDVIVTSGIGTLYPEGLLIGKVIEVYIPQPGLVKECRIRPATDFEHLEEVLVMIK
ncbi:MAG TPA: rod shape-determining protein MreC [Bacillota bacterium]|nr:rod shape-determining protein MreC [Candidatus Fermentithermobacillaceae bacterium]HOB30207.1 rod shape-determining protein MreC [Bacillota bacterium]HOK64184.1 rod shape-determining protein MreC [Bacillota bacterium]HOL11693.1 rod shape-determining protein MreC [Bacillota bacterium]HOQ02821.1 rod shape-determining protein MreC [Bacillota bacterium]